MSNDPGQQIALTGREQVLVERLADCWNLFLDLPASTSADRAEFQAGIHGLQHLVMARLARRAHPEVFNA